MEQKNDRDIHNIKPGSKTNNGNNGGNTVNNRTIVCTDCAVSANAVVALGAGRPLLLLLLLVALYLQLLLQLMLSF